MKCNKRSPSSLFFGTRIHRNNQVQLKIYRPFLLLHIYHQQTTIIYSKQRSSPVHFPLTLHSAILISSNRPMVSIDRLVTVAELHDDRHIRYHDHAID